MHISVHVRSGDLKTADLQLTTHCLTIFVAIDDQQQRITIPRWEPRTDEDRCYRHARHLMELRGQLGPASRPGSRWIDPGDPNVAGERVLKT